MTKTYKLRDKESLEDLAAYWLVKLDSVDCKPEDRVAFERWKRESPEHEVAFNKIREGNSLMDSLLDHELITELVEEARFETKSKFFTSWPIYAATVAAMVCFMFLGFFSWKFSQPETFQLLASNPETMVYETAIGERSTVPLSDGSVVTLNTNSKIEVDFDEDGRSIKLLKGQGFFDVAKDIERPFIVSAGDKRVIALGTAFDVRMHRPDLIEVTLVEGLIDVDFVNNDEAKIIETTQSVTEKKVISMKAGERLLADELESSHIAQTDTKAETIWLDGKVIFQDQELSEVVLEMNRYSTQKLILDSRSRPHALKVSGVFNTGRVSTFVEALTLMHPVYVEADQSNNLVLSLNH